MEHVQVFQAERGSITDHAHTEELIVASSMQALSPLEKLAVSQSGVDLPGQGKLKTRAGKGQRPFVGSRSDQGKEFLHSFGLKK